MDPGKTSWTLIQGAAAGDERARDTFVRLYQPVVRAYFGARWRNTPLAGDMDDAAQEVFVECFRDEGVLDKADPNAEGGGFRGFLYGVVRNVSHRFEERRANRRDGPPGSAVSFSAIAADEESLATAFDRAWSMALLDEANALHDERAREEGDGALRRLRILNLRLDRDLPVRDIATKLDLTADAVHYEYRKARKEFLSALKDVLAIHYPSDSDARKRELERLRELSR